VGFYGTRRHHNPEANALHGHVAVAECVWRSEGFTDSWRGVFGLLWNWHIMAAISHFPPLPPPRMASVNSQDLSTYFPPPPRIYRFYPQFTDIMKPLLRGLRVTIPASLSFCHWDHVISMFVSECASYPFLNAWTKLYEELWVSHCTSAHLDGVLHKSLPLVLCVLICVNN
jgi:hypothetical protein